MSPDYAFLQGQTPIRPSLPYHPYVRSVQKIGDGSRRLEGFPSTLHSDTIVFLKYLHVGITGELAALPCYDQFLTFRSEL